MLRADPYVTPGVPDVERSVAYELELKTFGYPLPVDPYVLVKKDPAYLLGSSSLSNALFFD